MLDRFRKYIENLFNTASPSEGKADAGPVSGDDSELSQTEPEKAGAELEAVVLARKEARKREARLILTERIHNRATTLMSELRNKLLIEIHDRLDEEASSQNLQDLLQVALDPAFNERLDAATEEQVETLIQNLRESFPDELELEAHLPSKQMLADDLRSYRDQILRTHMLEQIEVYALPPLTGAFPEGDVQPDELRQKIAEYWQACREALDRFFRSVEMALLNGARPGIRLDPSIIRERLVAAQYRNGYRVLEERFRTLYGQIADLQMHSEEQLMRQKSELDRRVVDRVIVPIAYFIRDRVEPEPREALRSRAELFREIIDKLVASTTPFVQTAEAIKPLLRRSIDQARPLALEHFPFLRPSIESLKPTEIHRATALMHLLDVLVEPEVDEQKLQTVEQSVRLNKWQYHLHLQLWRSYPAQLRRLQPLDRIHSQDAQFLLSSVENANPAPQAIEDLGVRLGYEDIAAIIDEEDAKSLLRALAVLTLARNELLSWHFLYDGQPARQPDLERLARTILRQIRPTSVGADDRQQQLGAVPLPVDLSKALAKIGYETEDRERYNKFRAELEELIISGDRQNLVRAIQWIRKLQQAVEEERLGLGLLGTEGDPYISEVWLKESGDMVGLLFYRGNGFGLVPVEKVTRDGSSGRRDDIHEKLVRQLSSQAVVYQAFHRLFSYEADLPRVRRQALPTYLKTTYEKIEPNRHALLAHLRNARLLLKRIDEFSHYISEAEHQAGTDAAKVERILAGLSRKVNELFDLVEKTKNPAQLSRFAREYERVVRYVNVVILHSVNPWLHRQTSGLATEFDYRKEEVVDAIREAAASFGLDWEKDIERHEAHRIRGTLGCRALLQLVDGSSKVVLLEYDRRRRAWQVKHFGPRVTDVVNDELCKYGLSVPRDYDEKYEQPTFSLEEQSCRFLVVKRNVARVEATLVLDPENDKSWKVVFLTYNDKTLLDRGGMTSEIT